MLMPKPWWDPNESESDYWDEEDTDAPAPVPPAQVAPAPVAPAPVPIAVGLVHNVYRRHRMVLRELPEIAVGEAAYRKIAKRAGVKRMSKLVKADAAKALRLFLELVLADASKYLDLSGKKVMTVTHIKLALQRQGHTVYI